MTKSSAARIFTSLVGKFLLVHGILTLLCRLVPPLDQAFPWILAITKMSVPHSILHIATGLFALAILRWGNSRDCIVYAAAVGLLYCGLGVYCLVTMHETLFKLQLFDHPFHMLVGMAGLACAAQSYKPQIADKAAGG